MEVGKESRVARYYFWSLGIWLSFDSYANEAKVEGEVARVREQGTDLCSMMRVMCVYAPLVIAAQVAFYVSGFAALVGVPIYLFGLYAWVVTMLRLLVAVVCIVAAFVLMYLLIASYEAIKERMRGMRMRRREVVESSRGLVVEWVRAKKQKVCPMITFVSQEEK